LLFGFTLIKLSFYKESHGSPSLSKSNTVGGTSAYPSLQARKGQDPDLAEPQYSSTRIDINSSQQMSRSEPSRREELQISTS
jgi:hypothetical protein